MGIALGVDSSVCDCVTPVSSRALVGVAASLNVYSGAVPPAGQDFSVSEPVAFPAGGVKITSWSSTFVEVAVVPLALMKRNVVALLAERIGVAPGETQEEC